MNSIPSASRVLLISINVEDRLGGTPSTCSKREMVFIAMDAFSARSLADQPNAARAALICIPVNIDPITIVHYKDN